MKITMQDLRNAKRLGRWQIEKDSMFYLRRNDADDLFKPGVVIKSGTVAEVVKIHRRGRCALLKYTDRTGKVWWSWTHATEYEPPRTYKRKDSLN
jgi:hypothetical protein